MKLLLFLLTLFIITGCSDKMRTRLGNCATADDSKAQCGSGDALTADNYRKEYKAQVTINISLGQKQLILDESAENEDFDQDYSCHLKVVQGTTFEYQITDGELILRNGITSLTFKKATGSTSDSILTTWTRSETVKKALVVTELEFLNKEVLHMKQNCFLK